AALIGRLAAENAEWGYDHIQGELLKPGYTIDSTTVKNALRPAGLLPAPPSTTASSLRFLYRRDVYLGDPLRLVILGEWHLWQVLREYVSFYTTRPHQGSLNSVQYRN